jgi:hypothetical protein
VSICQFRTRGFCSRTRHVSISNYETIAIPRPNRTSIPSRTRGAVLARVAAGFHQAAAWCVQVCLLRTQSES